MLKNDFFLRYKYSLIFGGVGFIFLLLAIILSVSSNLFGTNKKADSFTVTDNTEGQTKSSSSIKFYIDIEGAVLKPGVYEVNEGERIDDLLKKAGGFLESADLDFISKTINKAQVLSDGAKIYIPFKKENPSVEGAYLDDTNGLININFDSLARLESLPGIGEKTAQKIIDGRPYGDVSELQTKKIVSNSVFEKIKDQISVY